MRPLALHSAPVSSRASPAFTDEARKRRWSYPCTAAERQRRFTTTVLQLHGDTTTSQFEVDTNAALGRGLYGTVFAARAFSVTDAHAPWDCAVKMVAIGSAAARAAYETECAIFSLMPASGHPNVVKCLHYGGTMDTADVGVIVLERLPNTTLEEYVRAHGSLAPPDALAVLNQLARGVLYLHQLGISPRDIKPENIAFGGGARARATLFDFGLAAHIKAPHAHVRDFTGSYVYMAPEVLHELPHDSFAADMWCLGQVFFHMLVGRAMFEAADSLGALKAANRPDCPLDTATMVPDARCMTILRGLNQPDPKRRWRASQLVAFLHRV